MDDKKTVLIVEDDEDIRDAYRSILELEGFDVACAENGKVALELLSTMDKPCCVLLDMMMPIMNGQQFLENIVSRSDILPLPIVVVSANATGSSTLGAQKWLKKPVDMDDLINVVHKYCGACH